jgi:glycosyltransferase involved in cell wall biosynthesis
MARRVARVDHAEDRAKRAELGLAPGTWGIGSVANLPPEKNHDVLLQAFVRVVRRVPDARLLLAGEGDRRPALEHHLDGL